MKISLNFDTGVSSNFTWQMYSTYDFGEKHKIRVANMGYAQLILDTVCLSFACSTCGKVIEQFSFEDI